MFAIQYTHLGSPDVLQLTQVPDPTLNPGEVLIELHHASINHLDIHFRKGLPGEPTPLPHIPGSDGSGVVVKSLSPQFKAGDRVLVNPLIFCGTCEDCRNGAEHLCYKAKIVGREKDGTYAQFIALPEKNVLPVPEEVPLEVAACLPMVFLTAYSMIQKANLKPNSTVLVMGAGSGVSQAALLLLKHLKHTVFTTASTLEKRNLASTELSLDPNMVLDPNPDLLAKNVRDLTHKKGVHAVLDHVGGRLFVPLLKALKHGGTLVTCGATDAYDPPIDLRQIFFRQLRVVGSTMGTHEELFTVLKLCFQHKLYPRIDSRFPLAKAAQAHALVESRKSFGKILLDIKN